MSVISWQRGVLFVITTTTTTTTNVTMIIVNKQAALSATTTGSLYQMIYHNNDVSENQLINQHQMNMQSKWKRININSVNGKIVSPF